MITTLFVALIATLNAQSMEHQTQPRDVVTQLFVATDIQDWKEVEYCFANTVLLDYSSMGNPATTLTPRQITDAWKIILSGFTHTHHQIGNVQESIGKQRAKVSAYGTATHYLEDQKGSVWTVVGTYDFELIMQAEQWKISQMKFSFKYQDGNLLLPQKAMNEAVGKTNPPTEAERNKATVSVFLKTLEGENAEAMANLFAEDGKHINPYHSGLFPEGADGRDAIRSYWTPVFSNFDEMAFQLEELYVMEKPSLVFAKFQGKIKLKNNAGWYENEYYTTFKFDEEGKIIEYVEIFNPLVAAKHFGLLDQMK